MCAYGARHIAAGGRLAHVSRHMVGLFHGQPGARRFRQILSTEAARAGAGPQVLRAAFAAIELEAGRHGRGLTGAPSASHAMSPAPYPPPSSRKSEKQMHGLTMSAGEIGVFAAAIAVSGIVSGLLAGVFGIGGGAVLVPVFYQAFGLLGVDEAVRMHVSVGSSLAIIIPTSIRSFTAHRARGAVDMELLRYFLVPVPVGVILAALAAAYITSEGLRIIFSVHHRAGRAEALLQPRELADRHRDPRQSVARRHRRRHRLLLDADGDRRRRHEQHLHDALRPADAPGRGDLLGRRRDDRDPGHAGLHVGRLGGSASCRRISTGFVNWIAVLLVIPIALIVTPYGVHIAHG